jgi:hypothetical protein
MELAVEKKSSDLLEINKDQLACPTCEIQYGLMGDPERLSYKDGGAAKWSGYGDLVVLPVRCDEGHEWELCIGFHKGTLTTFQRARQHGKKVYRDDS